MASKIEGFSPVGPTRVGTAAPRAKSDPAKPVDSPAAADTLKLTGDAIDLQQLERALAQAPSVDVGKVAALRAAIESGTYKIDPDAIARRLAQFEQDLPQ
jgi:negative regulator of flagellin synthesis FlgM